MSINAAHRAVLGWALNELSAVPFWELVHPDDQQLLMEEPHQAKRRKGPHRPDRRFYFQSPLPSDGR